LIRKSKAFDLAFFVPIFKANKAERRNMLKNICIYPNYRILGDIKTTTFQQDGKQTKRISFAISSYRPDANGVFLKIYCHAFGDTADEILRSQLGDGDIITIIAEHGQHKTQKGTLESNYKVTGFTYVKQRTDENKAGDKQPKAPEQHAQVDAFMNVLNGIFS